MNSVSNSDVLCGKGPQSVKHLGNIRYCDYVKDQLDDFCNASKTGKHKFRQKVYKEVNKNGSFVKKNSDTNELEKLEENKRKPSTRKLKLENWGLREKIRYNKLKTGMEFLKATLKKSETDLHLLKTMK